MGEGKVTHDEIITVSDMLDDAEDTGLPDEEYVLAELVPILKRRLQRKALDGALTQYQHQGDISSALAEAQRAERLGIADENVGTILGPASFSQLQQLNKLQRLPTGIPELDDALGGGCYRGTLSVYMGDSGGGKSVMLIQDACTAAMLGFGVCFASLELPESIILARMKANMTGVPIDKILADPYGCGATEKLKRIQSNGSFGAIVVKAFSPMATQVPELTDWVHSTEAKWGIPIQCLHIDYADKCVAPKKNKEGDNLYTTGKLVYEGMRLWAERHGKWAKTACAGRGRDNKKRLDMADVSDSMHKVRVSDLWITLNPQDEDTQLSYFIAKNRLGTSRIAVGPLPHEWHTARIAPVLCDEYGVRT
jgi:hypothetical protein